MIKTIAMAKSGWIWKENLLPFLIILSNISSYNFGESDLEAISYGLTGTSEERNIWFSYNFDGEIPISIKLSNDPKQELIIYNLTFPDKLKEKLELVEYILGDFMLTPRNPIKMD